MNNRPCNCGNQQEFDFRQAIESLDRKINMLANCLSAVSSAGRSTVSRSAASRSAASRSAASPADNRLAKIVKRIIGGAPVSNDYAECCLVGQQQLGIGPRWYCTGVLIAPDVVLTAAHCHNPSVGLVPDRVALNIDSQNSLDPNEFIPVRSINIHPEYFNTGKLSDIAVLVLNRASGISPVNIAEESELSDPANDEIQLVGFGNSNPSGTSGFGTKREVEVDILYIRRDPNDNLDQAELDFGFESDLEFVAGGDGFDSCNGDSGGPAYLKLRNGTRKVAGLTSRGRLGSGQILPLCGSGGIYTRLDVNQNREFIEQFV